MLLFNYNVILVIVSSLIATITAQSIKIFSIFIIFVYFHFIFNILYIACPNQWWPLTFYSTSVSLITEVIKGNNINAINQVSTGGDRVSSTNNAAIYIKGGNIAAAYTSYLTLPTDTYFCSTAF